MKKLFIIVSILCLSFKVVFADPSVSSISGTVTHGANITISGSGFGTKSPAAPLHWDDCENKTTDSDTALESEYDDVWPNDYYELGDWNTKYRDAPFTPTANVGSISAPHDNSDKFIAGGHKDTRTSDSNNYGRNVLVLVDSGETNTRWFVNFYHRVTMPVPGDTDSHKFFRWQSGATHLNGDTSYIQWKGYGALTVPESNGTQCAMGVADDWDNTTAHTTGDGMPNPNLGWIHVVCKIINESGSDALFQLGTHGDYAIDFSNTTDIWAWNMRSVSLGGFYRNRIESGDDYYSDDAWRYYDDIYIDTTLSRVMVGNASTHANCTVLEPQIPSAWSAAEITAKVNLGALTGTTAYLYIFDSDNTCNANGYAITIGVIETKCNGSGSTVFGSGSTTIGE